MYLDIMGKWAFDKFQIINYNFIHCSQSYDINFFSICIISNIEIMRNIFQPLNFERPNCQFLLYLYFIKFKDYYKIKSP